MEVKKIPITVIAKDIEDIDNRPFCKIDIIDGKGRSFFGDEGGVEQDKYGNLLGEAIPKIICMLLEKYKPDLKDLLSLRRKNNATGDKGAEGDQESKSAKIFYESFDDPSEGEKRKYASFKNPKSQKICYYRKAARSDKRSGNVHRIQQIVDREGNEWIAADGKTTLVINTDKNSSEKIEDLARICQLVIPEDQREDCYILLDIGEKTESDQGKGKGKQNKEGGEMDIDFGNGRQVIYTGAPGTGKTFKIRKFVKEQCGKPNPDFPDLQRSMFVQFHSSYDYSDFVEGLRPVQLKIKGQGAEQDRYEVAFVRVDGVFKRFCRQIVEYNLAVLKKEGLLSDDKIALLQEACDLPADASDDAKEDRDAIRAKIMETKFYFVIDEINRADLGRVFGELMFGLEESYRGVENSFPTQYANLTTYNVDQEHPEENGYYGKEKADGGNGKEDVFERGFFIPENLYIIGSMNDIDRSVESIDFALRRRFKWVEVKANDVMKDVLNSINEDRENSMKPPELNKLVNRAQKLNEVISGPASENGGAQFGLNEAFHIGPAYFKNYDPTKPEDTWKTSVEPILREYVRGRNPEKVEKFIAACEKAFLANDKKGKEVKNNGRKAGKDTNTEQKPPASDQTPTGDQTSDGDATDATGEQA